jgi:hypothetical protein
MTGNEKLKEEQKRRHDYEKYEKEITDAIFNFIF